MTPEIVVVGSHAPALFIDVKRPPLPGETVLGSNFQEPKDGGKGSNQAIAAARLGAKVSFVGMVGKDRLGEELKEWFDDDGVDYSWLRQHPEASTGAGFNIQTEDGDCALVTCMGANEFINKEFIDEALGALKGAKVLLTQFEIPPAMALHAAKVAAELGITSIVNPAPAFSGEHLDYQNVSILIPNEIEAKAILGISLDDSIETKDLCTSVRKTCGVDCVIITLGEKGLAGLDKGGYWMQTSPKVECVDASGAGDAFCSALGVALVEGKDVREGSAWAAQAAALSVTKGGTIPAFPFRKELEQFIEQQ